MSHVFPRHSKIEVPVASRASGCYIFDSNGKKYFDGSGGAAVSCLGHGDKDIEEAIKNQLGKLAYAHNSFFSSEPAEDLANLLIEHAPSGLERVYFVSGGSEAMEASIKLARQYFVEKGEINRRHIIARKQSYHGNTLGALAIGGNELRRKQFSPLMFETNHIDACFSYREKKSHESEYAYGQRVAKSLEDKIIQLGPENVIAFVAETVVGSTLGAVTAVKGYFQKIREICDKYGILLILDEVMCGMGRTGSLFACAQENISPDIIAIAKGLGAGYQPVGAMICSNLIYEKISNGSGFFQHGHTYLAHPVACAAGFAVLSKLISNELTERVKRVGEKFFKELNNRFSKNPFVGDIRGRGLFLGIEFVKDKKTKETFNPSFQFHKKLKAAAFNNGLLCYPMGGTVDGVNGDHVLLAPPFIMKENHIEELLDKLSLSIKDVIK